VIGHTAQQIQSGDVFTLTTDDPNKKPLSSFNLLEMQWYFQRLTAVIGAGSAPEIGMDDNTSATSVEIPSDIAGDIVYN
jgi:hypothetical protein